ncbi:prenyltransferase [Aeropyrum camini SY1 = JCM 12091]|uniref:Prenyltransferase n=2 Tax=Aeropyrum camini TaxID=229980 RepID=U3TGI0_9CREN|nr:prenyltransferase [Aeropyrum camini SY1 = JCM 12091]
MRLVRIEHTIFSLPFAYVGALLSGYPFTLADAILMAAAVVGLRLAGMAYNNIADLDIDRLNPRTMRRPLVVGAVTMREAWAIVALGSAIYFASAALLNKYALLLSPLVLAIALTYPHAKRIHPLPHLHLGVVLGSVVFGGAVAASGDEASSLAEVLRSVPWLYVAAVSLWVAGFDTIYSIMDIDFDRNHGLKSIPAAIGEKGALAASLAMHAASIALFAMGVEAYDLGAIATASTALTASVIILVQTMAWLGRVKESFNLNLAVPILIGIGIIIDTLQHKLRFFSDG